LRRHLRPIRRVFGDALGALAYCKTIARYNVPLSQKPHGLPGELIVSLTSYRPRFPTLRPTLLCLLSQSMKPDRVILWISEDDLAFIPKDVIELKADGLEIRVAENLRVYTKIIPALKNYPEAFIITADDDTYYPPRWIEMLVNEWSGDGKQIVAHCAYEITYENGEPKSYNSWKWNVKGPSEKEDLFGLGVGGVLYPPGSLLRPEVLRDDLFAHLAPSADDLWLYWMARKNGSRYKKSSYNGYHIVWPGSQTVALAIENTGRVDGECAYDRKIRSLIDYYGWPDQ
jgi:hypothetical protein